MTQAINVNEAAVRGLFKGIGSARPMLDSEYIKPGRYMVRIDKTKFFQNRKKINRFGVEMTVVHIIDNAQGQGHSIGNSVTYIFRPESDYFQGEMKAFISCVLGIPHEQITEDDITEAGVEMFVKDEKILTGSVLEFTARNVVTQKDTDFTRVAFNRVLPAAEALTVLPENIVASFFPGQYLERRAAAEASATPSA